jgi:hypothetical protein
MDNIMIVPGENFLLPLPGRSFADLAKPDMVSLHEFLPIVFQMSDNSLLALVYSLFPRRFNWPPFHFSNYKHHVPSALRTVFDLVAIRFNKDTVRRTCSDQRSVIRRPTVDNC